MRTHTGDFGRHGRANMKGLQFFCHGLLLSTLYDHHTTLTSAIVFEAANPKAFRRLPLLGVISSAENYVPLSLCSMSAQRSASWLCSQQTCYALDLATSSFHHEPLKLPGASGLIRDRRYHPILLPAPARGPPQAKHPSPCSRSSSLSQHFRCNISLSHCRLGVILFTQTTRDHDVLFVGSSRSLHWLSLRTSGVTLIWSMM